MFCLLTYFYMVLIIFCQLKANLHVGVCRNRFALSKKKRIYLFIYILIQPKYNLLLFFQMMSTLPLFSFYERFSLFDSLFSNFKLPSLNIKTSQNNCTQTGLSARSVHDFVDFKNHWRAISIWIVFIGIRWVVFFFSDNHHKKGKVRTVIFRQRYKKIAYVISRVRPYM